MGFEPGVVGWKVPDGSTELRRHPIVILQKLQQKYENKNKERREGIGSFFGCSLLSW